MSKRTKVGYGRAGFGGAVALAVGAAALFSACEKKEAPPAPGAAPAAPAPAKAEADTGPIKVGILHSLSGTMAISETSLKDVALMAIEEINEEGGVLGRKLEPVVVDPASNWPLFAEKARDLIANEKVAVTFGCWTSVSRKSVLPVFEELNGLLFYPVQYEGEESSFNVFYTGAAPNQQAIPAVEYLMSAKGGGAKRFVLLGTDYVYPRTTNKILRYFLPSKGVKKEDIMETYTPFGHSDYQTIVADIKKFAAGKRTAVISTINGDSNVPFYKELGNQGLKAEDIPVVAFSVGEEELRGIDTKPLVGHLAAWNYFMSLDTPENKEFVDKWNGVREEEQPARRRQARHQRPDGSHLHRHQDVGAGGRAGAHHQRRRRSPGHRRPDGQGALGLRRHHGRQEPPPAQAGLHRRGQGRRPVQDRVEDRGPDPRPGLEPVHPGEREEGRRLDLPVGLRQLHRAEVRGGGQEPGRRKAQYDRSRRSSTRYMPELATRPMGPRTLSIRSGEGLGRCCLTRPVRSRAHGARAGGSPRAAPPAAAAPPGARSPRRCGDWDRRRRGGREDHRRPWATRATCRRCARWRRCTTID